MRTSIGFTVLTLLASAGSPIGAPVAVKAPNTVARSNGQHHHRRSDSQSQSLVVNMGDDKPKFSNVMDMHAEAEETHNDSENKHHHHRSNDHHQKEMQDEQTNQLNTKPDDSEMNMFKDVNKRATRSRAHIARASGAIIQVLPSKAPSQKAGVVDAGIPNNGEAHVLQTPGDDKTIVHVNAGAVDAKVNLPKGDPARDQANGQMNDGGNVFNNGGSNLAAVRPSGRPLSGIANDGQGGPQGLEIAMGSNGRPVANSSSASASRPPAASSAPPPVSSAPSAPPRSSDPASSARPSASQSSVSRAPASRSSAPPVSRSASASVNGFRPTSSVSQSRASAPPRSSVSASASRSAPASSVSSRPAQSSSAAPPPASSSSSASRSSSQSASHSAPAPSASNSDSDFVLHILPGAFSATKNPLNPLITTDDPHSPNPDENHGGITIDGGHKALDSTLGQAPQGSTDRTRPARIEFGHLPQNTIPCDGVMVRDRGDVVDMCIELAMFDQRPNGYDACPEYQHELTAHGDTKKTTDRVDKDMKKLIKLCYGAGAL